MIWDHLLISNTLAKNQQNGQSFLPTALHVKKKFISKTFHSFSLFLNYYLKMNKSIPRKSIAVKDQLLISNSKKNY